MVLDKLKKNILGKARFTNLGKNMNMQPGEGEREREIVLLFSAKMERINRRGSAGIRAVQLPEKGDKEKKTC